MKKQHEEKKAVIGIDAGSSVIKAVLYTLDGTLVDSEARNTEILRNQPLWAECDMNDVWEKVKVCLTQLAERTVDSYSIIGIGITGQGDGTWLVDDAFNPVRPAVTWLDGRTGSLVEELHENGTSAEVFALTGTSINSSSQAAQLLWMKQHEPETLERAYAALRAKDWIYLKLTGTVSTDETDASFTYFDIRNNRYDDHVLELYGLSEYKHLLPPAPPSYENFSPILHEIAAETGLPDSISVVSGPLDVCASSLGVGVSEPGEGNTVFGTAGIHQIVIDNPPGPPEDIGYSIAQGPKGRWLRLLPTKTGTLNVQWFVEKLFGSDAYDSRGKIDWPRIEGELENIPVGSRGILYHPFIDPSGERAPFINHNARAQFTGIHLGHTRNDLLHAAFEGVVLSALDCYSYLPYNPKEIRLTGGGANSPFWSQMFADALGTPVRHVIEKEAGTKGAMINACVALGVYDSFSEAIKHTVTPGKLFEPNREKHAKYMNLLQLYRNTYKTMAPIWKQLNELVRSDFHEPPGSDFSEK